MFRLGHLTVGKRIGLGFGAVLAALVAVVAFSFTGVGGIVDNAKDVIYGNTLDAAMTQKEVDHLNWVNHVNALLSDESVTTLTVQTDAHKCGFGKWLYGDARTEAEGKVHGLGAILKEIETPHAELHKSAVRIGEAFKQADPKLPGLIVARQVDHLKWADLIRDCILANGDSLNVQIDPTQCALGTWLGGEQGRNTYAGSSVPFKKAWDQTVATHEKLHQSARKINETYVQIHPGLERVLTARLLDHKNWVQQVCERLIDGEAALGVATDPTQCAYGRFLSSPQYAEYAKSFPALREAVGGSREPHDKLHASAIRISDALDRGAEGKLEATRVFKNDTLPALAEVGACFDKAITAERKRVEAQTESLRLFNEVTLPLLKNTMQNLDEMRLAAQRDLEGMNEANAIYASHTLPNVKKVQALLHDARRVVKDGIMTQEAMLAAAQETRRNTGIFGGIGIVAGIVLAFLIAAGITKALKKIALGLSAGAEQTASAAGQVASASQSFAQGASEQAASIEETSSSAEEMSSMCRQNAGNAGRARELSESASAGAEKGAEAMHRMSGAIEEIKKSSDETAKIIKTIDEIAFQTNLLALNAAVEAARAGEAGKGFAVVAQEVRHLAQRSAEAARNTADMIEESVKNADNGVGISREVSEAFDEIAEGNREVKNLIAEIATASHEQAQGIEQINTAVGQMDQVTQSNAAGAEESSSASEELNAQAEQLNRMVQDLQALVGGAAGGKRGAVRPVGRNAARSLGQRLIPFGNEAPSPGTVNCWEVKKCGRTPGGDKADELGVCPAYPDSGTRCWTVAGTFCGGEVQGTWADKQGGCLVCGFYKQAKASAGPEARLGASDASWHEIARGARSNSEKALTLGETDIASF